MKKLSCILTLIFLCASIFLVIDTASAQTKVIKKTVTKVVTPQIAPAEPPEEPAKEEIPSLEAPPPPPLPPKSYEIKVKEEDKGLFGWGLNSDLSAYVLSGQGSLFGLRGNIIFSDPLLIGEKIGLAEDAVEYKLGLGATLGTGSDGNTLKTIPLFADMVVYLKEGSFFGLDPLIGAGLNYNLLGSGSVMGGLGYQAYFGILADLKLGSGQTGFMLGFKGHEVANVRQANGLFFGVAQPLKL